LLSSTVDSLSDKPALCRKSATGVGIGERLSTSATDLSTFVAVPCEAMSSSSSPSAASSSSSPGSSCALGDLTD